MATNSRKSVLITGCSQGSLGDALAQAFHGRGLFVIASARDLTKVIHLQNMDITTISLDVLSPTSIATAVEAVRTLTGSSGLNILVNNSGGLYSMPLADASIQAAKDLFDLNVWAGLAVSQAFLPLLMQAKEPLIVNQTSISGIMPVPLTGIYNASKAAFASITDTMRLELQPFGIKVIDLKTGSVRSGFFKNQNKGTGMSKLPSTSIYAVAKDEVESAMIGGATVKDAVPAEKWAAEVVQELMKVKPSRRVWKGGNAAAVWFSKRFMPHDFLDGNMAKLGALDVVGKRLAEQK